MSKLRNNAEATAYQFFVWWRYKKHPSENTSNQARHYKIFCVNRNTGFKF